MVSIIANTYNSIQYLLFVCTRWSGSKYCYLTLIIQFNISHLFIHSNDQTVLFLTIQFNISYSFKLSLNVKLSYLTHRWDPIRCNHSGPESTREQWKWRVLHIPQNFSFTGASRSDCFVSYPRRLLGGGFTRQQWNSGYILSPQPIGQGNIRGLMWTWWCRGCLCICKYLIDC